MKTAGLFAGTSVPLGKGIHGPESLPTDSPCILVLTIHKGGKWQQLANMMKFYYSLTRSSLKNRTPQYCHISALHDTWEPVKIKKACAANLGIYALVLETRGAGNFLEYRLSLITSEIEQLR